MVADLSVGRANPNDLVLGRGILYFSPHNSAGHPIGYRDLGNCTKFGLTMESQEVDHVSSRQSVRFVDRQVLLQQKLSLGFTLDEVNDDNLALWGAGTKGTKTLHLQPVMGTADNIDQGTTLVGGRWYDLFLTAAGTPAANVFDDRVYDLTGAVTVTGGTSPAEGTDYLLDRKIGRIFIVSGGTLDGVTTSALACSAGSAGTYNEARFFTGTALRGSLKFVQVNPANADQLYEWEFHKVQLKATGEMQLIGDTWSEMSFTGVAEKNTAQSATSPVCSRRTYALAQGIVAD